MQHNNNNIDDFVDYEAEFKPYIKKASKSNGQLVGLCPFHDDREHSFSVNLKTGEWHCFREDIGGNVLSFFARLNNTSTKDEYKRLLEKYGINYKKLNKKPQNKNYDLEQYAFEKKLPVEFLKNAFKLSTITTQGGIKLLKIPYFNENGEEITFRRRGANKTFTWKKGSAGKICPYNEWNIEKIRKSGYCILVEGESDTQTLTFLGFPALGIPGASMFKADWTELIQGLRIYIHKESDSGGETFVRKVCEKLKEGGFNGEAYIFSCKNAGAKDPSEIYLKSDKIKAAETIKKLLQDAESVDLYAEKTEEPNENALTYLDEKGKVKEGLLTEYCKANINYIVLQTPGRNNAQAFTLKDGVYVPLSENDLKGEILRLMPIELRRQSYATNVSKNLLALAERKFNFDEVDIYERFINFRNGILNIESGELLPHDIFYQQHPDFLSTIQVQANYNPGATCPKFMKFLDELQTKDDGKVDSNARELLLEVLGLTISNLNVAKYTKTVFILYSRIPDTGKSQYIKLIRELIGKQNCGTTDLDRLSNVRFGTSDLFGKRLGYCGDMPRVKIDDVSIFMQMTGGDGASAEQKGKDKFDLDYRGSLIFATNTLPYIDGEKGEAVNERLTIIPCTHQPKKKNKKLVEELLTESDGIIFEAIKALKRFIDNDFSLPSSTYIDEYKENYKREASSVYRFLCAENGPYVLTKNKNDLVKRADFKKAYADWARIPENEVANPVSPGRIRYHLQGFGVIDKHTRTGDYFVGIGLRKLTQVETVYNENEIAEIFSN